MKTKLALAAGVAAVGLLCSAYAMAATQSVTANIAFDTAISLTKNADINFGSVAALTAGNYTIDTTGAVVAAGGGVWLFGTPAAADITVAGSTTQTIDIVANNYAADNGVTPSDATCSYNGGAEAACGTLSGVAAPGAGKTLLIGAKVTVDGTQASGTAETPTFDIVVTYT